MPSPRVLFMHGLESGPHGDKVQRLREAGLDVEAADMKMSIRRLDRENSVVRNLLRSNEARLGALSFAASAAASVRWRRVWPAVLGVAAGAGWLARRGAVLQRDALRRSYETCIAIQEEAVARHRPDVVLGSSWGGAIAIELVLRGAWRGPTVLLAPAFHRVAQRLRSTTCAADVELLQRRADAQRIVVFHDPTDETIPFGDSVALQGTSEMELRRVHAGGHRLMGLLDDGSLVAALRDVASIS